MIDVRKNTAPKTLDITDPSHNVYADHFIEASAGTGKTFTIEKMVFRLLTEKCPLRKRPLVPSEIAILTFTNKAKSELKERIFKNLEEEKLLSAIASFHECKIVTIHGFCMDILHLLSDEEGAVVRKNTHFMQHLQRVLEGLSSFERRKILNTYRNQLQLMSADLYPLIFAEQAVDTAPDYGILLQAFCEVWNKAFDQEALEDFSRFFKGTLPPLDSLMEGSLEDIFSRMPFTFFLEKNRDKRKKLPSDHPFLDSEMYSLWCRLGHIQEQYFKPETILRRISTQLRETLFQDRQDYISEYPDILLDLLLEHFADEENVSRVLNQYACIIVDEFQDTDHKQWQIFETLMHARNAHNTFVFVGDPKQSIYGFRNSDIYSFLQAKGMFKSLNIWSLCTNYRSCEQFVHSLNAWYTGASSFALPKIQGSLPLTPVAVGNAEERAIVDGKAPFHFFTMERIETKGQKKCPALSEEQEYIFPQIAHELTHLQQLGEDLGQVAVLVADRFKSHSVSLVNYFANGSTIMIRFRLHSNASESGYGWVIDNLSIQTESILGTGRSQENLSIYPNPVVNEATLRFAGTVPSEVIVYDLNGKRMDVINTGGNREVVWDSNSLKRGVYLVKYSINGVAHSQKVIIR